MALSTIEVGLIMAFSFVYFPNLPVDAAQTVLKATDECHSSRHSAYPARNPAFVQVLSRKALGLCREESRFNNALKIKPCVNSDHSSTSGCTST